jgi:hypothetical protein
MDLFFGLENPGTKELEKLKKEIDKWKVPIPQL